MAVTNPTPDLPEIPVKTCKKCGETKPGTEFAQFRYICKQCRYAYEKEWKAIHPEQTRKYSARHWPKYYAKQRAARIPKPPIVHDPPLICPRVCDRCNVMKNTPEFYIRVSRRTGYLTQEHVCKSCRVHSISAWKGIHPESARKSYQKHAAERYRKGQAWKKANPIKTAQMFQRGIAKRKARKRELPNIFTKEDHTFCYQYWGYACAYCGREEGFLWTLALDHFIPLAVPECLGTVPWNILPACHGISGCNNRKHKLLPQTWLPERFGKRKAALILKRIEAYFAITRERHASPSS